MAERCDFSDLPVTSCALACCRNRIPEHRPEPCGSCPLCVVIAELDAARVAHRAAVRALSQALGERDRLADGIREHRDYEFPEGSFTPTERFSQAVRASERLWALLDVATDDREDGR